MTVPLVGYGSAGWRYSIVGWNGGAGFESPSFNDATWASGTGGFGDGGCGLPANTPWGLNSDLLVRRWVTVPMNGRIRVAAKIDNDVQAFVNGIALSSLTVFEGCGGSERYSSISPPLTSGPTLVAVRARDRGGHSYFDARIEVVFDADCNGDGIVDYGQCRDGSLPDYDGNNVPDCCEAGVPCSVGSYPVQWRAEDGGNGHWYEAITDQAPYQSQAGDAAARGGSVVTIADLDENTFVYQLARSRAIPSVWIGLVQSLDAPEPDGGWTWSDGSDSSWRYWGVGEPNNWQYDEDNCKMVVSEVPAGDYWAARWQDYPSFWNIAAIVEWSADCSGDGIVDYGQILDGTFADVNSNGVPDTCDCPADLNQSGTVDAEDLAYVLFAWGTVGGKTPEADIDRSGTVDANDLSIVLGSWGACP